MDRSPLDRAELTYWMAYYQMDPWGEERADLRMGILASLTANINRGKGKRRFQPKDFMPEFRRRRTEPMDADEIRDALAAWGEFGKRANRNTPRG